MSEPTWVRVVSQHGEGATVALLRLPLPITNMAGIARAWPDAVMTESKPLEVCIADMREAEQPRDWDDDMDWDGK